jgi:hypothetical protein
VTSEPTASDRYFFVHMMRTGGSVLRLRLIDHFGEAAVYPTEADVDDLTRDHRVEATEPGAGPYMFIHLLRERLAVRGDEIRVITGHFPLCTAELIGGGFTTLTLLREPVDRTLSYLRRQREIEKSDSHKSLEEIYDDPVRFHRVVQNHMTKMLSMTPVEMTEGVLTRIELSREHLERAKDALARIDAVGLQERFEDFCDQLTTRFGWRLDEPKAMNVTAPVDVPKSFRDRIAADNVLDVELYEFARELIGSRVVGVAE